MTKFENKFLRSAAYGIVDSGAFGFRIVSGIVTGIRYTENDPVYTIEFGKNRWETKLVALSEEELIKLFKLPSLDRIKETHGLKIKFGYD